MATKTIELDYTPELNRKIIHKAGVPGDNLPDNLMQFMCKHYDNNNIIEGKRILVIRMLDLAKQYAVKNSVTYITDNPEKYDEFLKAINNEQKYGCDDSVELIEDWKNIGELLKDMPKFDVVIMNPPYDKNLHLKILEKIIPVADKVVNISPIRWLQDPLAKYKKNSDYNKFENSISKKIDYIEIVNGITATNLFGADFVSDLAIYTLSTGEFDYKCFNNNSIVDKVVTDKCKKLINVLEHNKKDGWRVRISEMRPVPSFAPNSNVTKSFTFETTHYIHSWIYYDGYTPDGKTYWTDNNTTKGSRDKTKIGDNIPMSLHFISQNEATNYEKSTKTKFHRYLVLKMKTDAHFPLKYIPYMSDYTKPWNNKRFCEYFDITGYIDDEHAEPNSEWEIILKTMKEYV